jgi:hypothetical protein
MRILKFQLSISRLAILSMNQLFHGLIRKEYIIIDLSSRLSHAQSQILPVVAHCRFPFRAEQTATNRKEEQIWCQLLIRHYCQQYQWGVYRYNDMGHNFGDSSDIFSTMLFGKCQGGRVQATRVRVEHEMHSWLRWIALVHAADPLFLCLPRTLWLQSSVINALFGFGRGSVGFHWFRRRVPAAPNTTSYVFSSRIEKPINDQVC